LKESTDGVDRTVLVRSELINREWCLGGLGILL